jgi:tripartite-type tricarboxylate transporter receptor subunit TctC
MFRFARYAGTALVCALSAWASPSKADAVADFYKGKNVSLYIGSGVGGGYDTYARVLGRHWGHHIPGKPNFVAKNMAGAASLAMTNFVNNQAPKDGTAIGAPQNIIPFEGLLRLLSDDGQKAQFDSREMNWLGSAARDVYLLIAWHTAPVKTFEDLKTHELVLGSSGPNTEHSTTANLCNELFGTKLKVVTGYKGGSDVALAIERGEVQGMSGRAYSSLLSGNPDWIRDKKIRILLQFGLKPHPDLKGVPFALDLVKNPLDRKMLEFIFTKYEILRLYFAPAGVPADRVAALRAAFDATMKDSAFLADAKKARIEIDPVSGAEVQAMVQNLYEAPPEVVERARAVMGGH